MGSSLVTNEGKGLDETAIGEWCRQIAMLMREGKEIIMVSSGAIAEGMKRLGWLTRPHEVHELQAESLERLYEERLRSRVPHDCGIMVAPVHDGYYALRLPEAPHRVFKFMEPIEPEV